MINPSIVEKIRHSVRMSIPLTVTTYVLPHETEEQIEDILEAYLDVFGQCEIKNYIAYCIKELAVNAKKANTKRVYFEKKNLEIQNSEDYANGMLSFKEETLSNNNYWLNLQKEKGLYIKFLFIPKGRNFQVAVKNNVEITRKEQMRIYDRIARSRAFESMEEAFSEVLDDSEGAGLGIVILVLMLRKMGLNEDAYDIEGSEGTTTASITIPLHKVKLEKLDILIKQIVDKIESLPQFPDNIVAIQRLIDNPKSEISDIARKISNDPTLTADMLKTVNSAQFMLTKKVNKILDAVKMLGLKGIKNMLFNYGTGKILNLPAHAELWEHAHKVAFYSFTLARQITKNKDIIDDAYIGGVLHDIGKIIFSAVHPELLEHIRNFCKEKDIEPELFEDLSAGYNHAEIGAKVAEKWNFSETLIQAIRYHHDPNSCLPKHKIVVYCVYLANAICGCEKKEKSYDTLDYSILAKFHITSEDEFNHVLNRLSKDYQVEVKRD